jgi:hypothetical protein
MTHRHVRRERPFFRSDDIRTHEQVTKTFPPVLREGSSCIQDIRARRPTPAFRSARRSLRSSSQFVNAREPQIDSLSIYHCCR